MFESGEKEEEYREIKEYWIKRLIVTFGEQDSQIEFKKYDEVLFSNGYSKTARKMRFELIKIYIGMGITKWGAPKHEQVFIIKTGKRLA